MARIPASGIQHTIRAGEYEAVIASVGAIELERLYEPPFTTLDADSIDGLFDDEDQIDELLALIASFKNPEITVDHPDSGGLQA